MKLRVEIENVAFDDRGEVPRIPRMVADDFERKYDMNKVGDHYTLFDVNGNKGGIAKVMK